MLPLSINTCQSLGLHYTDFKQFSEIDRVLIESGPTAEFYCLDRSIHEQIMLYAESTYRVDQQLSSMRAPHKWLNKLLSIDDINQSINRVMRCIRFHCMQFYLQNGYWPLLGVVQGDFKLFRWTRYDWDEVLQIPLPHVAGTAPQCGAAMSWIMRLLLGGQTALSACFFIEFPLDLLSTMSLSQQDHFVMMSMQTISTLDNYLSIIQRIAWLLHHELYDWVISYRDHITRSYQYLSSWQPHEYYGELRVDDINVYLADHYDARVRDLYHEFMICLNESGDKIEDMSRIWQLRLQLAYFQWRAGHLAINEFDFADALKVMLLPSHQDAVKCWVAQEAIMSLHKWVSCHINDHDFSQDVAEKVHYYANLLSLLGMHALVDEWHLLVEISDEMIPRQIDIVTNHVNDSVGHLQDKYGWVSESVLPYCGQSYQHNEEMSTADILRCGLWSIKEPIHLDHRPKRKIITVDMIKVDHSLARLCENDNMLRACCDLSGRLVKL